MVSLRDTHSGERFGSNSATKSASLGGSVAMNSGLMARFSSSRWQVPQVLPFPLNCSLKKIVLPWFIRVSTAVSDPSSPLPPPSGIGPTSACAVGIRISTRLFHRLSLAGSAVAGQTGQVHIGEFPKLPALAALIETVKQRRRSHQNTFFCRILAPACYDVKVRVEVRRMLCFRGWPRALQALPACFNLPTWTIASPASGVTLLPGPLSINQKSQALSPGKPFGFNRDDPVYKI